MCPEPGQLDRIQAVDNHNSYSKLRSPTVNRHIDLIECASLYSPDPTYPNIISAQ
jgi:hypothetical protein